ncbi:MAG: TRAP transporter large permease subunit [Pseudomonadota bacterium]
MILVAIVFFTLLVMGLPVAFAMGAAGAVFFLQHPELPFTQPAQQTISQTQNFLLLAVPLFIFAGSLLNHSGITKRLLNLATILTGRLRGGLAQASLALSAMMGGVSGSAIADAAMQSRMIGDEMVDRGMPRGFVAAILSFGAVLTPIIPPGIGMILYGTIGQVSIGRMFAAGIVPALLLWLALGLATAITARRSGWRPEQTRRPTRREAFRALGAGFWALLFPVFLLLGLRSGLFTPSEIGAFAVVYGLFVGFIIYREMNARSFGTSVATSLADIGAVMLLIAMSAALSYGIILERVPETIASSVLDLTDNLQLIMVIIVLMVIAAGFFIDATILIIILTPIVLPLVEAQGGNDVHFGIVFIIAATIGNFTPPVGAAMYAVCTILKVPIGEYTRASLPLIAAVTAVIVALIFLPNLVLFLPNVLF